MRRLAVLLCACGLLTACGDTWLGDNAPAPLPGKRISILTQSKALEADEAAGQGAILLPPPEKVADWPQPGGYAPHAMHHLALGDKLEQVWSASLGAGAAKRRAFLSAPVVRDGVVYAMDALSTVSAFDLKTGERAWQVDLAPEDADGGSYGGGLAIEDGKLFVTSAFAQLFALDPKTGKTLWSQTLPAPVRGAPTVRAGRVLVVTVDNQALALSAEDGHQLWHHNGINELATLLGGSSPAVDGNVVVVPYSSGELFALRIENGTVLWSDVVSSVKRTDQVATLTDIRGLPVIDRGRVYAAGNSDMVAAIDLRSGRRVWDREIGSIQTPWVAGDYIYLITNSNELTCIDTQKGLVRWVSPLQTWSDPEDKKGRLVWTGPVLASDRLIIASSDGQVVSVSPYNGQVLGKIELSDGVTIPPVVADKTLLLVTTDGELVAFR